MSNTDVLESSNRRLRELAEEGGTIIGYLYPHTPLELFMAHRLTPSLIRVSQNVSAGFEDSLQTFSCAFTRNIFSQRANGGMVDYGGFLFPGNTCDALQNVGDVWRKRFSEDKVLRLTYPVSTGSEASIDYLAEEIRMLSNKLEELYGSPLSMEDFEDAVSLTNSFRSGVQYLYASRIVNPDSPSYRSLIQLVIDFLMAPEMKLLTPLEEMIAGAKDKMDADEKASTDKLLDALKSGDFSSITNDALSEQTRLLVLGGMVDPLNFADLIDSIENASANVISLDMFSFSYKYIFTPEIRQSTKPFYELAKSILQAPLEPTQSGLKTRMAYVRELLSTGIFDGLVVCEQSFCDPDEFEAPSMIKVADSLGVPSLRLPLDPEMSDRGRLEGRLQTFLETIKGA